MIFASAALSIVAIGLSVASLVSLSRSRKLLRDLSNELRDLADYGPYVRAAINEVKRAEQQLIDSLKPEGVSE